MKYLKMPLKYNGITGDYWKQTSPYSKSNPHKGLDLGWHEYQGEPVYSAYNGLVFKISKSTGSNNAGNQVWIRHYVDDTYDLITRYCHLKDNSILVKENDNVSVGQQIVLMGNTYGYATHLHYEMWKVPKNWKYNWNDRLKYVVNPLDYTYAYDDQQIATSDEEKITRVIGNSILASKDNTKEQLEVVGYKLRVRTEPTLNGKVLGYIQLGLYNIVDTKVVDGYTWCQLENNNWVAIVENFSKITKEDNYKELYEKELLINKDLKLQIEQLNNKIEKAMKDLK